MAAGCNQKTGSGVIISENRSVGPFNAIEISGGFDVEVKIGDAESVMVESDDNLMKYVIVKVQDNKLKVQLRKINVVNAHLTLKITAREINSIKASAAAEVVTADVIKNNSNINLSASSGSEIRAKVDAPTVTISASSGGDIAVNGLSKDVDASASSGSTIDAFELLSENGVAKVSSGGTLKLSASRSLNASASSGGSIRYRGAANVQKSESSGGSVAAE